MTGECRNGAHRFDICNCDGARVIREVSKQHEAKGYKAGLREAAEMAEERARLLRDDASNVYGSLAISLTGGAVELESQAARLRALAEKE